LKSIRQHQAVKLNFQKSVAVTTQVRTIKKMVRMPGLTRSQSRRRRKLTDKKIQQIRLDVKRASFANPKKVKLASSAVQVPEGTSTAPASFDITRA
jgi:hypothetical protein